MNENCRGQAQVPALIYLFESLPNPLLRKERG